MSSASDLTKAQSIISPKLKLLSLSLIATSFVILVWSFLAKIPVNSNGKAYFVPSFKVKPFLTKSSGRIKLLSKKESNAIFNSIEELSSITGKDRSKFISTEKNISKIIDQYKFINIEDYKPINSLNNGTLNLNKLKNNLDNLDNLVFKLDGLFSSKVKRNNNISDASLNSINQQKSFCYKKEYPIFFVSNNQQKNNLLLEMQNSSDQLLKVSSKYNRLFNEELRELDSVKILKSKLNTAKDLFERKLITQTTFASSQQIYFSKVNDIAAISLERQGLVVGLNDSIAALQRATNIFLDNTFITNDKNICILQQNIPDGSDSLSGDQLGIGMPPEYFYNLNKKVNLKKNKQTNEIGSSEKILAFQIPFFYLSDKDKGIKDGDKAVIYPNNVPKNTYGGIKGKVITSKKILANEDDTQFITGFKNIRPYENEFNNGKLVYYGVIELDKDPTTTSGFKWTSGQGPNYPVLIGTEAQVLVTVGNEPPISKLLPSFR